jgi:hypothetical protein
MSPKKRARNTIKKRDPAYETSVEIVAGHSDGW